VYRVIVGQDQLRSGNGFGPTGPGTGPS
jgi:hypothetical protein